MSFRAFCRVSLTLLLLMALSASLPSEPASAQAPDLSSAVVRVDGVDGTELIRSDNTKSRVRAMEAVGNAVLVGGPFEQVVDVSAGRRVAQSHLAAFDASSGDFIESFRPGVNGAVLDIVDMGDGTVVIAGEFDRVNGVSAPGLAIIEVATGRLVTSFGGGISGGNAAVNSVLVSGGDLYAVGSFTTASGPGGSVSVANAARFRLSDGAPSSAWRPQLQFGGGRGIATDGQRIFIGGYFLRVNDTDGTTGVVAVSPTDGSLDPNWRQGVPDSPDLPTNLNTFMVERPEINDLDIVGSSVIYGSKHHVITLLSASSGEEIRSHATTNGAQVIHVDGDRAYVGCHCSTRGESIWELDANGTELGHPGASMRGAAGPWGLTTAPDGCLWTGGDIGSGTSAAGSRVPVFDVARICPTSGVGAAGPDVVGVSGLEDRAAPLAIASTPSVNQRSATVDVTWPHPSPAEQLRFEVSRDGVVVGSTGGTTFSDRSASIGVHEWRVRSVDLAGNASSWSPRSAPVRIVAAVNIAPTAAVESTEPNPLFPLSNAVDGDTSNRFRTVAVDANIRLDLGAVITVDSIDVVKSDENLRALGYFHLLYSTSPYGDTTTDDARDQTFRVATMPGAGHTEPLIEIPVNTELRGLRLGYHRSTGFNTIVDLADIRVWTTPAVAQPASPAADVTAPSGVQWARAETNGGVATMRIGGALDDRGVTGYEIHRDGAIIARIAGDTWTHGEVGLLPRDVGIVALDAAGNQSPMYGNPGQAEALDTERPSVPSGVTATNAGADNVLTWNPSTDNVAVATYIIYRDTNADADFTPIHVTVDTNYTDTSAEPGATHRYYIRASDAAGNQSWRTGYRTVYALGTDNERPSRPTEVTATNDGPTNTLTWVASTDNVAVTTYTIYRDTDEDGVFTAIGDTANTSYTDQSIEAGVTYRYYVRASDAAGNQSWRTGYRTVFPEGTDTERPTIPGQVTAANDGADNELSWSPSSDNIAVTNYTIYRDTNGDDDFSPIGTTADTAYTDTTVEPGAVHRYYIRASDAAGNQSWRTGYRTPPVIN